MQSEVELINKNNPENQESRNGIETIPGPKGKFLVGNLLDTPLDQFHEYLKESAQAFGKIFKLSVAKKHIVVLSDPNTVRSILNNRPHKFRRNTTIEHVFSDLGLNGVFSSEGEAWSNQRQIINQVFTPSQLSQSYPVIIKTANRLLDNFQHYIKLGCGADIQAMMQRYTLDISTQLTLGLDANILKEDSELQNTLTTLLPTINRRLKSPILYWRYVKTKSDKELVSGLDKLKTQFSQLIKEAEQDVKRKKAPNNTLEAMIMARNEGNISLTHDQIFSNIINLLLAGEAKTANTLSWIIHYLVENPRVQQKLQSEINIAATQMDLNNPKFLYKLPLLTAVIQETMRLMPVSPLIYLENIADQTLEGFQLPAGTTLVLINSQTGHNEKRFPHAEVFLPQRWLTMESEVKRQHAVDLMHFGAGTRACPGMQLAFTEIKYAIITMLKHITFSKSDDYAVKSNFDFTVSPKNLLVRVTRNK